MAAAAIFESVKQQ